MDSAATPLATWVARVEADLKGKSYASVFWQHLDGFALPPLVTAHDVAALPHLDATALLRARRGFATHALISAPTPELANAAARRALARGADRIEFCLDALAQDALDPDAATADDDDSMQAGDGGVAIHDHAALATALADLDLGATDLSFAAGEGALPILAWWLRLADARGVPRAALRGALDVDPIARLTTRRVELTDDSTVAAHRAAVEPVFGETVAAIHTCATHCPGVRPLVVDGQAYHLIGASPALELGATIAAAIEVARRLHDRGIPFDVFARATTVRVQVGHELATEIAKLRALRLLWAKVAQACGGTELAPRVLGITSGRFRSEHFDQRTNLVRTALAGFAAVVGGCDAVAVMPYADDAGRAAHDVALDQLHLLRDEAHLGRVADPVGGSFALEKLTDELARRAWEFVQEIETDGGLLAQTRSGALAERLALAEGARERAFRTRRRALVGISRFADLELGGPVGEPAADDTPPFTRRPRDRARAERLVAAIGAAAPARFFEFALGDDADHATLAELATATWPPEPVAFEHGFLPVAVTDGYEFELLRREVDAAREDGITVPRVLLVPFGPARLARARADFARDLFAVAGLDIDTVPHAESVDGALAAIGRDPRAVVVLCSDDAAYADALARLRAALGGAWPRVLVAGRVQLAADLGVDATFHAGMDVVEFLTRLLARLGVLLDEE